MMVRGIGIIVRPGEPPYISWIVAGTLVLITGALGIWADILLLEAASVVMGGSVMFLNACTNYRVHKDLKDVRCEGEMSISYECSNDGKYFYFISDPDHAPDGSDDRDRPRT